MHYSTKTTFGKIIWYLGDSNGGSFGTVGNMGSLYGDFLYLDDLSMNRERLDVAHFSIRTKTQDLINYVVRIKIDEDVFDIKLVDKGSEDCLKCIQGRNRKVH